MSIDNELSKIAASVTPAEELGLKEERLEAFMALLPSERDSILRVSREAISIIKSKRTYAEKLEEAAQERYVQGVYEDEIAREARSLSPEARQFIPVQAVEFLPKDGLAEAV